MILLGLIDDILPLNDLESFFTNPSSSARRHSQLYDPLVTPDSRRRMDYVLAPPATSCHPSQFLVIYVHSAPSHHDRRQTVRSTWGNVTRWSTASDPVSLWFILGRPSNDSDDLQQAALASEQAQHQDLVQLDFVDSYRNMTLKAVGALQWLTEFCHNTRYCTVHNVYTRTPYMPYSIILSVIRPSLLNGAHCSNLYEDRPIYYQQQKCRPMNLVSSNIRFMGIFVGVPLGGGVK